MGRVNRLLYALPAAALLALALSSVAAAATPSPSPSLDHILVAAPAGYTELTTSQLSGQFNAHGWATTVASGNSATETENTLKHDGFVDGFGKVWAQVGAGRALIEAVMAFSGGKGARKALTALEASDKAESSYKRADTLSGIEPYYGAHLEDTTNGTFGDLFVFVKGNDLFLVIVASQKDDVLQVATNQTRAQYDAAPASTIPTSQWPENVSAAGGYTVIGIGIIGFVVVAVAVAVGVVVMRRRSTTAYPAMAGAYSPAPAAIQLSPDGNYWWDGQAWRDAAAEAPPSAQRSSDGTLWWDGRNWRPVPQPAQPQPSPGPQPPTDWPTS